MVAGRGLGRAMAVEAKGRLLPRLPSPSLSCCSTGLTVGPEVPPKHRNKSVLPGAGNSPAQKNPQTSPTGLDSLNLRGRFWDLLLPAAMQPPLKAVQFPGECGEGSPPPPITKATLQTREPKPLVWHVPERWAPLSLLCQVLVSRRITATHRGAPCLHSPAGTHWAKQRDKNSPKEKQSTNTSPAAGKHRSNTPLPFFARLTCTLLHLRCLGHPKSKSKISPAFLSKFGVKRIKTFPHTYRTDFLKKPQILPPGSLRGYFFLILLLATL